MLHERGEFHVERCRQLADGGWSDRQSLQDFPPSRVGQGVKNVVSDCGLNHFNTSRLVGLPDLTERFYHRTTLRSIPKYCFLKSMAIEAEWKFEPTRLGRSGVQSIDAAGRPAKGECLARAAQRTLKLTSDPAD